MAKDICANYVGSLSFFSFIPDEKCKAGFKWRIKKTKQISSSTSVFPWHRTQWRFSILSALAKNVTLLPVDPSTQMRVPTWDKITSLDGWNYHTSCGQRSRSCKKEECLSDCGIELNQNRFLLRQQNMPKIHFDISKLCQVREDQFITQQKLMFKKA